MGLRITGIVCALLCALVWGTSADAAVVVPVPGLTGSGLLIASAQRTDTGGGVLLSVTASDRGDATLTRVDADGAPDLAYGRAGVARLAVAQGFQATGLTIDPATGDAWVGGRLDGRAAVVAVGATGRPLTGFGRHGIITLPAGQNEVTHISWRAGALLVSTANTPASGTPYCESCLLSELSPDSGHPLASRDLAPSDFDTTCPVVALSQVLWDGSSVLVATVGSDCRAQTFTLSGRLSSPPTPVSRPVPVRTGLIDLASGGGQICEASQTGGISLWGQGQSRATDLSRDNGAFATAIVPIGAGACAALVTDNAGGSSVFQVAAGGAPSARTAVPNDFVADTMFRCNAHLLVVGTVGKQAAILAVPLSRGPYVAKPARARAQFARSTGCTT